ncbi:MAG: membrane protein insertase YidC [Acidobacteria bacterium]|nr:membrane protein insertase YidC [Acidobacteriota bacterium]
MEKRLLLAVAISVAVLLGSQALLRKFYPPPSSPPTKTEPDVEIAPKSTPAPVAVLPSLPEIEGAHRTLVIENGEYRAVVDNQGAVLKSFQLKKYKSKSGGSLELIPQKLPPESSSPLALEVPENSALTQRVKQAVYQVYIDKVPVEESRFVPPVELTFLYRDDEIQVQKVLRFYAAQYSLEIAAQVWAQGNQQKVVFVLGPDIGTEAEEGESDFQGRQVAVNVAGSIRREGFSKGKSQVYSEPVVWAGFDTKYFAALAIPAKQPFSLRVTRFDIKRKDASGKESTIAYYSMRYPLDTERVKLYFGPKDYDVLNSVKPDLSSIIDYGWFSFIVQPLLLSLRFIHKFAANWGVAIIVLTFLISLALFPIRYKQMISMKKMQALQPKMRSIQDRYKKYKRTDPKRQEMNAEIMNLYKEHGVNPMAGCLPLLIQMPFLFAFYRMLDASIELRGAPFIFWIHDLSKMDPYYVTPILMGATMVLQQKMTPQTTTDPAQARMMTLMPIIFTAMFFTLSSGLVLYFLFSNLFAVGFQKLAEMWMPVEDVAKKKKVRGGKE